MPSTDNGDNAHMAATVGRLQEAAEFYLCLARAFLAPRAASDHRGFTELLADDLAELGEALGYPIAGALGSFRASLHDGLDRLSLLQLYSRLFLTPPTPVHINAGYYLDGSVSGPSVAAMEAHYRRHGLGRAEAFHDLPDHVALQLEFVTYLFARAAQAAERGEAQEAARLTAAARDFLGRFVAVWLPRFSADLERALAQHGVGAPYLHLARILRAAVERDATVFELWAEAATGASLHRGPRLDPIAEAATATSTVAPIAASGPTPAQLQEIARALSAHGQPTEYLGTPFEARDAALGLTRLTPPGLKRSRPG